MEQTAVMQRIKQLLDGHIELRFLRALLEDFPSGEVYLVGGAVRDAILGRECIDFDFVVRGIPSEALEKWLSSQGQVDFVGRNFGVYKFLPAGYKSPQHEFIDIALPRTEETVRDSQGGYRDFEISTHPFLPILYDLERRDFTVNAIAFELRSQTLFDPFNGLKDIERAVIRAVGTPAFRFGEDLSRMLRAIRFAVQLGFTIEPKTWTAITENIHRINERRATNSSLMDKVLRRQNDFVVPRETIGKEFIKSVAGSADQTLKLWSEAGALGILMPAVKMGSGGDAGILPVRLAGIFSSLGAKSAGEIYDEFVFGGVGSHHPHFVAKSLFVDLIAATDELVAHNPLTLPAHQFEKHFMTAHATEIFTVAELRDQVPTDRIAAAKQRRAEIYARLDIAPGESIAPLLTGDEIMAATQTKPGPKVGELANKLRDAQLEGKIGDKRQALDFLGKIR